MKTMAIVMVCIFNAHVLFGQDELSYAVSHITLEDGQALGYTRDIVQDSTGLIWISSSRTGIHLYDGHRVKTLHPNSSDYHFPLPHGAQIALRENGNFIISDYNYNGSAIYEYNPYSRQVVDTLLQNIPSVKRLYEPIVSQDGKVWVVSDPFEEGDFVYLFKEGKKGSLDIIDTIDINTFPRILTYQDRIYVSGASFINAYAIDGSLIKQYPLSDGDKVVSPMLMGYTGSDGELYVKSDHNAEEPELSSSLFRYNSTTDQFDKILTVYEDVMINTEYVVSIDDDLWLGGLHESLVRYDKITKTWEDYTQAIRDVVAKDFYVLGIFKDDSEQIWVTTSVGLVKLAPRHRRKFQFILNKESEDCQGDCKIISMTEDEKFIYFSFFDYIITEHKRTGQIEKYNFTLKDRQKGSTQEFQWDIGSSRLDMIEGQLLWMDYLIDPSSQQSKDLLEDHNDFRVVSKVIDDRYIWLAPFYPSSADEMLYKYNIASGETENISPELTLYPDDLINQIYESQYHDRVWIAYSSLKDVGFIAYTKSGDFIRKVYIDGDFQNEVDKIVYSFAEDTTGNLWLGTAFGLVKWDIVADTMQSFPNYLPSTQGVQATTSIYSITQTNDSIFWLTANKGIHRFNLNTQSYTTPALPTTLSELRGSICAPIIRPNGDLYMGTRDGVLIFNPEDFTPAPYVYPIAVTELRTYNRKSEDEVVIHYDLQDLKTIDLYPMDLWFSLEYTLPEYGAQNFYKYKLEGFDNEWSQPSLNNILKYTNLPVGQYTLHLRASRDLRMTSYTDREITIVVHQAWYLTWWFMCLAGAFILSVIGLAIRHYYRLENNKLQLEQEKEKGERLEELDQMKSRFYTNITHEFRTPLTVIMGIADNIRGHGKEKDLIQRNSENLLRLVNQLLDLSKSEHAQLTVNNQHGDIVVFLKYLTESFYSLANSKHIRLTFYAEIEKLYVSYDEEKIQQIFYNILSNAIKYTEEYGKVILHLKSEQNEDQHLLQVKLKDTGIGIAPDELTHIFDRFYQADNSHTRTGEGTGVGLALTKELVTVLGGQITVKSDLGQGTEVNVTLPFDIDEEVKIAPGIVINENTASDTMVASDSGALIDNSIKQADQPLILVIEDNQDVATYIEMILTPQYEVVIAINGQKGSDKAVDIIPDIIITDVMMPIMDGYEVTQVLKKDERTSHIPIIMLTAKAATDERIDGLRHGADAYLVKPFHKEELFLTINNALELTQRLRTSISTREAPNDGSALEVESSFLQKIDDFIEDNIDNPELNTDYVSQQLGLSRSQVYRKVKALTGLSITQVIKNHRLKKAHTLLADTDANISEVAYAVGFQDPSYFSRAFYQAYGVSPSDYRK